MSENELTILEPGTMVEGFQIERVLGSGAMAIVYKALQVSLSRPVALKLMLQEFVEDEEFINRFFNEAKAAATLSHPNIVQAFDAGITENNTAFFAMEYVEGETILEHIETGCLTMKEAIQTAIEVARALDYGWIHRQLTHGDIKPANILYSVTGASKLADFGLAKAGEHIFEGETMMLTPLYAAPEAIKREIDHPTSLTDIYAYGATVYHMLTGSPPYPGEDGEEVMQRHVNEALIPAHERNPKVPRPLSEVVAKLLEKDPRNRPQSWSETLNLIETAASEAASPAPTPPPKAAPGAPAKRTFSKKNSAGHRASGSRSKGRKSPKRGASPGSKRKGLSRKVRSQPASKVKLIFGLLVGSNILIFLIIVAIISSKDGEEVSPDPNNNKMTVPKNLRESDESDLSGMSKKAREYWRSTKRLLKKKDDPSRNISILNEFERKFPNGKPPQFDKLKRYYLEQLLAPEPDSGTNQDNDQSSNSGSDSPLSSDTSRHQTKPLNNKRPRGTTTVSVDQEKATAAYFKLLKKLSEHTPYYPGKPVSPLRESLKNWWTKHQSYRGATNPAIEKATFLTNTVIPSLSDFTPFILENSTLFTGKQLGNPFKEYKIKQLLQPGIKAARTLRTDRGNATIEKRLSWSQAGQSFVPTVSDFLKTGSIGKQTYQNCLAYLLFSEAFDSLVKHSAPSSFTLGEKDYWAAIASDLAHAENNFAAARALTSIDPTIVRPNDLQKVLRRIEDTNSFFRTVFSERIQKIKDAYEAVTPKRSPRKSRGQIQNQKKNGI